MTIMSVMLHIAGAGVLYLSPAMLCQFHPVIGNELVDIAILVSFRLCMADQYDHLQDT